MFKSSIRSLATAATTASSATTSATAAAAAATATTATSTTSTERVLNVSQPPLYTLAQLRTFPTLEPKTFLPLPISFFKTENPLRRDVLWSSVVYEADKARVGSNNAVTKSDSPYSNRKLRPQKGSGRARVGDANSPHMDNEIKAHVITGPHDWSTGLPRKIYNLGYKNAFTSAYKTGGLNVIENEIDFDYGFEMVSQMFISTHRLQDKNLLFIVDSERKNLSDSITKYFIDRKKFDKLKASEKPRYMRRLRGKVIKKEDVEVRDILRAEKVFIELPALQWFLTEYAE